MHALNRQAPEPLSAAKARRLRQLLVIVADASSRIGGNPSKTLGGPDALETIIAAADATIDTANRHSFDALRKALRA